MSVGSAKKARKARDIPSSSTRGRWSDADSANELALQDLLGDIAHACTTTHGRLLNDLKGRRLVEAALLHEHLLGALDNLTRFDLVVNVTHFGVVFLFGRRTEEGRQLGQNLTRSKRLHE